MAVQVTSVRPKEDKTLENTITVARTAMDFKNSFGKGSKNPDDSGLSAVDRRLKKLEGKKDGE